MAKTNQLFELEHDIVMQLYYVERIFTYQHAWNANSSVWAIINIQPIRPFFSDESMTEIEIFFTKQSNLIFLFVNN